MLFGCDASHAIHRISSAGASTGAHAITAAKRSADPAAAAHDRAPFTANSTSHGRRMWASDAPRWPAVREPRNGGARPQSSAATAGSHGRTLKRLAQNQAPKVATGKATRESRNT